MIQLPTHAKYFMQHKGFYYAKLSNNYTQSANMICRFGRLRKSHSKKQKPYVTRFVQIDPNHTGIEIHFIAEH